MFSTGFNAGVNARVKLDANDRANAAETRAQKQQQLTALQMGMEEDTNGNYKRDSLHQNQYKVELEKTRAELDAIKSQAEGMQAKMYADSLASVFSDWATGDHNDALSAWENTPGLKDKFRAAPTLNIHDIDTPNLSNPKDLQQLSQMGIDTSKLSDPEVAKAITNSFLRIQGNDGTWRLEPVDKLVAASNSMHFMRSEQKAKFAEALNRNIQAISKGINPKASEVQDNQLDNQNDLAVKTKEARDKFFEEHPKATLDDYKSYIKQSMTPVTADQELKNLKLMETKENKIINDFVDNNPKEFSSMLQQSSLDSKIPIGGSEVPVYRIAKKVQGDRKLATARRDYLDGMVSTLKNTSRLKKELSKSNFDWDALSKGMDELSKITGTEWRQLSEKEKSDMLKRFSFNSDLKTVMAGYIKAMSGAAVSDEERKFYENAIISGNWSTKEAALASMDGFISGLKGGYKSSLDSIVYNLPATYLERKEQLNSLGIDDSSPKDADNDGDTNSKDTDNDGDGIDPGIKNLDIDYTTISKEDAKKLPDSEKILWLKAHGVNVGDK